MVLTAWIHRWNRWSFDERHKFLDLAIKIAVAIIAAVWTIYSSVQRNREIAGQLQKAESDKTQEIVDRRHAAEAAEKVSSAQVVASIASLITCEASAQRQALLTVLPAIAPYHAADVFRALGQCPQTPESHERNTERYEASAKHQLDLEFWSKVEAARDFLRYGLTDEAAGRFDEAYDRMAARPDGGPQALPPVRIELAEQARAAFKRGDYTTAADLYNKAFERAASPRSK
jgi:tetratricopeptide (TPR) repeat protein